MLAAGHAEVEVVEDEQRHPDVAAGGVEEVRAADAGSPVAHDDDDLEFGAGQLDPGGVGEAAAVQSVEGAGGEVLIRQTGAADVGDQHDLFRIAIQTDERRVELVEYGAMAAARTERIGRLVAVGGQRHDGGVHHQRLHDLFGRDELSVDPVDADHPAPAGQSFDLPAILPQVQLGNHHPLDTLEGRSDGSLRNRPQALHDQQRKLRRLRPGAV